jgi:hypothetical protein
MQPAQPRDRMMEVLDAARETVIADYVHRAQATIPGYDRLPPDKLRQTSEALIGVLFTALRAHDPSILSRHLTELTPMRLEQGFSPESQIAMAQIMDAIIRETVTRGLADDPAALASATKRIDSMAAMGRNAIGRIVLAKMVTPKE